MLITPWMLIQAVLFALGILWCSQMLPRWRDDLKRYRNPDDFSDRAVVVILWSITGVIFFSCFCFGLTIAWRIARAI
jgi:hypothetical protein